MSYAKRVRRGKGKLFVEPGMLGYGWVLRLPKMRITEMWERTWHSTPEEAIRVGKEWCRLHLHERVQIEIPDCPLLAKEPE